MTKEKFIVTAAQMREIEERIFAAGMPVAALMEKVASLLAKRIQEIAPIPTPSIPPPPPLKRGGLIAPIPTPSIPPPPPLKRGGLEEKIAPIPHSQFPIKPPPFQGGPGGIFRSNSPKVGIIVGPGHNGGDALVVARELHFRGYRVSIHAPFSKLKELTNHHAKYAKSLGIPFFLKISQLEKCDLLIDGLFGFGLEREITGDLATTVETINSWQKPIFSIDIPSGIHTDTGEVLGVAIRATRSFCLGLWKLAFLQDRALEYIGTPELIDFDIPLADITAILGESPQIERITRESALASLPLPRPPASYKYRNGHLLVIAGSRLYSGAAILTALGARGSGVGMLTVAVPDSIKLLLNAQLPEALIVGCPETEAGAIRELPPELELGKFDAIACGPGLTKEATSVVQTVLAANCPLVLDADGLNICAKLAANNSQQRPAPTVITPHLGEFRTLFPELAEESDRLEAARKAVEQASCLLLAGSVLLFKGARAIVASPSNSRGETIPKIWINPESTAALARGGSGDVLTGLIGGLLAGCRRFGDGLAGPASVGEVVKTAVWWHAQAAMLGAEERTELGVDAYTLTEYLMRALR